MYGLSNNDQTWKSRYWKQSKHFWEFWWFPSLFSKEFEDKNSASHKKVHDNAIIQNEKPQRAAKWYIQPAIMRIFPVVSTKHWQGGVL